MTLFNINIDTKCTNFYFSFASFYIFFFFMIKTKNMTKLNADCLNIIFGELKGDKNSLLSCLLVNKEWCNIAVPILWKTHSWDGDSWYDSRYDYCGNGPERKLFNTILSCLPS